MTRIYLATFEAGEIEFTRGARETLNRDDSLRCLYRHLSCDWGECGEEARRENDLALKEGYQLFSVYRDRNGTEFFIITEADRAETTILLPSEY